MRIIQNQAPGVALGRLLQKSTASEIARQIGLSRSAVAHAAAGRKAIPDALLEYLGFERVQIIRKRDARSK